MKVYRIEILVLDHDGLGEGEILDLIESARYPNHAIRPQVMDVDTREVEWSDDHPLNYAGSMEAAYCELFDLEAPSPEE